MKKSILLLGIFLSFSPLLCGQTGLGTPAFGSFSNGGFDTVNNQNLNVFFAIPIASSPGRGLPLNLNLVYNSLVWQNLGGDWYPVADASGNSFSWGWQKNFPSGSISYSTSTSPPAKCYQGGQFYWATTTYYSNYVYTDPLGTPHIFPVNYHTSACPLWNGGTGPPAYAGDHSGYYLSQAYTNPIVLGPNGQREGGSTSTATDVNGNFVTQTVVSSTETDWTDSVGNKALKVIYSPSATAPTSIQYEFLDGNGNYQTITLKLQAYSIKTNFGCSVVEYSGTAYLPYELDIPSPVSGTIKYSFSYEATPGNSGYFTGRLQQVTLPTGGSYQYIYSATNDGINCSDGTTLGMNRIVNDNNGNSGTWNFVRNTSNLTTTVTTPGLPDIPNKFDTVYTFNSSGEEITRKIYANSPGTTVLRTINTGWATNGTPSTSITILEDGSTQNEIATTYDSNGLLDSATEYDWGTGSPGSPIRTTSYSYQTSSNYTSQNLINLVTSKVIKDGSGTVQYRQDTTYDGVGLSSCPTGAAQHDDSGHPCTSNYRGNPTAATTYTSPAGPSGGITKNFTYDWFGNLLTAQLNCCTSKTWAYSGLTQYSQPDSVTSGTSPTQLTTSYSYNLYLGLMTKSTDPNTLVTNYTYDFLRRPFQISQVNGQTVSYSYNDTAFTTTTTTTIDSSKSVQQVSSVDGLGRVLVSTTKDGSGNTISNVSANYDLLGRAYKTSNPYTGSPSYWTTAAFDVLGRPTSVTLPDGSTTTYSPYAEQYVTVTDPAGKKRKSQTDGAGRLAAVTEPDTSGNLVSTTYYTYNVLDELIGVADAPSNPTQSRTYNYDALGRLFTAKTPEGGTTCFGTTSGGSCMANTGYDNFDNLLYRTDARGVVTSYTYDGLNRLKGVSYNVGTTGVPATASVSFTYGTNASQYNNGFLITMTDGVGSENYSYNALEQLTQLQKVINGTTFTTSYAYNIAGELTQITYPSGRVIQQSVDAIGRLCEIAPSTTGCGTASNPYATGYGYNVASQVTGFKYGNGIYASLGFSPDRLQLNCLDYSTTNRGTTCTHDSTTKFGLSYSYGSAGRNNGRISSITDSVDNGRTVTYTYDPLSRLSTALTTGSANFPQWGLSWGYDRYGNRKSQTLTAGSGYQGSVAVSAVTNQITTSGYAYDANGNMTNDGINTLVYDAENHAVLSSGTLGSGSYTYDGNGNRVQKVSGATTTVYIFSGTKVMAEYDSGAPPAGPTREYVYGGGTLLSRLGSIDVRFTNDSCSACGGNPVGGGDRNLFINSITAGSTTVLPGDPSVSYITPPCNSDSGGVGALNCNGDMITTATAAESAQTITVNAYGSPDYNIYPHMQLLVGGNIVAQWDVTGTAQNYTITLQSTATQYFSGDHLSNRLVIDSAGNTVEQMGHYPFGDPWYNATNDKLYFTTYERDAESSNDYAQARFYRWLLGRFLSPDPLSGSTGDPQSLDRYTYVENNPINFIDPTGMDGILVGTDGSTVSNVGYGDGGWLGDVGSLPLPNVGSLIDLSGSSSQCPECYVITTPIQVSSQPAFGTLSNSIGYMDPSQGGGDLIGTPSPSASLSNPSVAGGLYRLQSLLKNDPNCLQFLNSKAPAGADSLSNLNNIINLGLYGRDLLPATFNSSGVPTSVTNAQDGPTALAPNAAIVVNGLGSYFYPNFMGLPNLADALHNIGGGTRQGQVFILLHELAHSTNAIAPDHDDPTGQIHRQNDKALQKNCKDTIKAAK
jgi:RHS repeat-associated protein